MSKIFHITNGGSLTNYLEELNIEGEKLTWHEMLCEGPTECKIDSDTFYDKRRHFINTVYGFDSDNYKLSGEIEKLNNIEAYSEIVLWFEYDLFCHINLVAVINLLQQKGITLPLYLVCSGRIKDEKTLKGLSELKPKQLIEHYKNKVQLNETDIDLAVSIWQVYNSKDHNLLKPYIVKNSSFEYLSRCLKAHLKRFPDSKSGLNTLELNILKIINEYPIKSKHHLLGYALNYQGFYGYGDVQLELIIDNLSSFYNIEEDRITLTREGHKCILKQANLGDKIKNTMQFGGSNQSDFVFDVKQNKLLNKICQ